jgi:NAD(P)-dependent dehydrogenase (short-subunit alcohol dehydrogenase family)
MTGTRVKVAVVTGGSRGIGREIAERLARDGYDVALASSTPEALIKASKEIEATSGRRVVPCVVDLRNAGAATQVLGVVESEFGQTDVLVNCAGATKGGAFTELSDEVWADGFALKFFGAVRLCRAFWPSLRRSRGTVINIVGGFARTPDPDFMIGGAVNAAFANFSKALSKQGLRDDINVNAIHPGTIVTERLFSIAKTRADLENRSAQDVFNSMLSREGLRRLGKPEDVANLVSFLCNPDSRHIQGAAIAIDGGATASNF